MNVHECNGRIFPWGERLIVPFNEAIAELNGTINLSPNENILTIARIKTFIICFFDNFQFIRHLKQHAFESYFSIWIISHSSQDRNQPKVKYEDRTKSFLIESCELWECNGKNYCTPRSAMQRFPLHAWKMELFISYQVTIINQLNNQNLMRYLYNNSYTWIAHNKLLHVDKLDYYILSVKVHFFLFLIG